MKKKLTKLLVLVAFIISFSSCTTVNKSMKEPNVRVELEKSDFTLSEQFTAEATSTRIIGIDFERLFLKKTGTVESSASTTINFANLPVIGTVLFDKTSNFALYELMKNNPGYDVVFYPQYETTVVKPFLGIGFIVKKTTVKTTARLGKLN
jgi:hypothetical protein